MSNVQRYITRGRGVRAKRYVALHGGWGEVKMSIFSVTYLLNVPFGVKLKILKILQYLEKNLIYS